MNAPSEGVVKGENDMNRIGKIFLPFLLICAIVIGRLPVMALAVEATGDYTADIRWDFDMDAEGFVADGCTIEQMETDGEGTLCVSNIASGVVSTELQNVTDAYTYLRIRMKTFGTMKNVNVKFLGTDGEFYGLTVPVSNGAEDNFADCEVNLKENTVSWILADGSESTEPVAVLTGSKGTLSGVNNKSELSMSFTSDNSEAKVSIDSIVLTVYPRPMKNPPIRWDFETEGNVESFREFELDDCGISLTQETVDGMGCLKIAPRDGCQKGYAEVPLDKIPSVYKYLRFRLKNVSKVWNPSIRLVSAPYTSRMKQWSVKVQIPNNNKDTFTDYLVKLEEPMAYVDGKPFGNSANCKKNSDCAATMADVGEYELMRLFFEALRTSSGNDPALYFDFIELRADEGNSTVTPPVASIMIDGTEISGFNRSTDKYKVILNYKTYDLINANTVSDYVSADAVNGAVVTGMRYKETENYKIVDIGAKASDGTTRGYRVIMTASERPVVDASLNVECEVGKYGVTVIGCVTSDERRPVSIKVTNTTDNKIVWVGEVMPDAKGYFSKFIGIQSSDICGSECVLKIEIDVKGIMNAYSVTKSFIKSEADENLIRDLCMAANVSEYIKDHIAEFNSLGVWADKWSGADVSVMAAEKIFESEKSSITIENAAEKLNGVFVAGALSEMTSDEIAALILKYDKEVKKISISDKSFNDFTESERKWIAANVIKATSSGEAVKRLSDFETALKESMLLDEVNSATYGELADLLTNNEDVLGINLEKMKSAKGTSELTAKMKALSEACKTEPYEDIDDLIKDVKSVLISLGNSTDSGSSVSGGGNGKGFVSISGASNMTNDNMNTDSELQEENSFIDMADYKWAEEAVESLRVKNIVSGVGNRRFEPGRAVTREEFVKLVVEAFGYDREQTSAEFTDVDPNAWYAPYVSAAAGNGIITGFPDRTFGIGESITREDMAVIIYRGIEEKLNVAGNDIRFDDETEISDYAEVSVKSLSACGVVNGVGDNKFSPKVITNRAEAAMIIYRCINILN